MGQRARPNAMLLAGFSSVFEALPFDGTGLAECFGGFYGRLAHLPVGYVLGEEQVRHFTAGSATGFFDGYEEFCV